MPRKAIVPPPGGQGHAPGGVTSVDRALSVLRAFTVTTPVRSLSELAEHTRQYKSTVLRMLASLEFADLVRRHGDGRFSLGPAVARLHAVHRTTFSLGEVVQPVLAGLVEATRESAAFHVPHGEHDLCLYRADSPHPVRDHLRAGDVQPLARSASGRVILAYAGGGGGRAARICREQILVANGDVVPELAAIAAPVFAPDGSLAGVLSLTMPSVRFDAGHVPRVTGAARHLTLRIGGSYPPRPPPARGGSGQGRAVAAPDGANTNLQSR